MKKIYICGLTHSGKGALRPLLDGHPKIVTCPYQGFGYGLISDEFINLMVLKKNRSLSDKNKIKQSLRHTINVKYKDLLVRLRISEIIHFLYKSQGFGEFFDSIITKKIRSGSGQEIEVFIDFVFDYNLFFNDLIDELEKFDGNEVELESLQDMLYKVFVNAADIHNNIETDSLYFVQSAPNRIRTIENIIERNENSYIIIVNRDIVGRCYSNAKHIANKNITGSEVINSDSKIFYSNNIIKNYNHNLYSEPFIREDYDFKIKTQKLSDTYQNIKIIDFENLITDKQNTMDDISEFLGIEKDNIFYKATLLSKNLEKDKIKFHDNIKDNPYKVLSKNQIRYINYLFNNKSMILWHRPYFFAIKKLMALLYKSIFIKKFLQRIKMLKLFSLK